MSQSLSQARNSFAPTTGRVQRVGLVVGLVVAVLLHAAIIVATLFGWQHQLEIADESPPVVPVDVITIGAKTNIAPTIERHQQPQPKDEVTPHVSRRLLQLVVKAAAQLDVHEVDVVSSHRGRARKGSRHRSGEAIDFVFPGIPPKKLAEILRKLPRVGVAVYVNPRSQFVHLDVRDQSYHWVDGSPPGRSWREQPLPDPTAAGRDAAYTPDQDLPDGAT